MAEAPLLRARVARRGGKQRVACRGVEMLHVSGECPLEMN